MKTKSECASAIEAIERVINGENPKEIRKKLIEELKKSDNNIIDSVITCHRELCKQKNMGEKDAFGHDPAIFYSLALAGEIGELANNLIKVIRVGGSQKEKKKAIENELPDVQIYSVLLAYTNGIDLTRITNNKAKIVVKRAVDGYYGGPIMKKNI